MPTCLGFAEEIAAAREFGVEICLVIGGGNIFRGMKGRCPGHGALAGRLDGHAGDHHERAGHAKRAGIHWRADPRSVGHSDG